MSNSTKRFYEFGPYRLDAEDRLLFKDGQLVSLPPKIFDILLALVEKDGRVLEKDELMQEVWPDTFVEEGNLARNVSTLRKLLGEGEGGQQYVETIPRRGYRFAASVKHTDQGTVIVRERSRVTIEQEEVVTDGEAEKAAIEKGLLAGAQARSLMPARTIFLLILIVALAGVVYWFWNKSKQAARPLVRSMAVLPFKPLVAESGDEYLGLGMTDALITRLGRTNQIIVRPTSAVRKYTAQQQDPVAAGQELKVESVLDGSIQKIGDRVRLTLQLVNVADGRHLWAEQFDEKFTDILAVEDAISARVAERLALKLSGEEQRQLAKRYTEIAEAHQLYLKGRYLWNKRTEDGLKKAIECFEQSIEIDHAYAVAYAGLADSYILYGSLFVVRPPKESYEKAKAAAERALELDDRLAEAHASLAMVRSQYDWDWPGAEREFRRSIELEPNYATAHHWYAFHLSAMGRFDEAIAEIKRAQELDPLSLIINTDTGTILFFARRDDEAIDQCKKTLELDPNFNQAHLVLSVIYAQEHLYDQWMAERQRMMILSGDTERAATLARIYAQSGYDGVLEKQIGELKAKAQSSYVSPYAMALLYAQIGDKGGAFEWLEKAFQERSSGMSDLKVRPAFESLRSDPRFAELLRRTGLTQ